jgi:hypothetical protein
MGDLWLGNNFVIHIRGVAIPIPFTGSLRLWFFSWLVLELLWRGTRRLERIFDVDLLYEIDRLLNLGLRRGWLYPERIFRSGKIAERLARLVLTLSGLLVLLVIPLAAILFIGKPWLIQFVGTRVLHWLLKDLRVPITSPAVSFLILRAAKARQDERRRCLHRDIKRNQIDRKKKYTGGVY